MLNQTRGQRFNKLPDDGDSYAPNDLLKKKRFFLQNLTLDHSMSSPTPSFTTRLQYIFPSIILLYRQGVTL